MLALQVIGWPSAEQIETNPRKTRTQIQVVHGQGPTDLLKIVVMLVHNPGHIPSSNGMPFQSAASASDTGEVDTPGGMRLAGCVFGIAVCLADIDNPPIPAIA